MKFGYGLVWGFVQVLLFRNKIIFNVNFQFEGILYVWVELFCQCVYLSLVFICWKFNVLEYYVLEYYVYLNFVYYSEKCWEEFFYGEFVVG